MKKVIATAMQSDKQKKSLLGGRLLVSTLFEPTSSGGGGRLFISISDPIISISSPESLSLVFCLVVLMSICDSLWGDSYDSKGIWNFGWTRFKILCGLLLRSQTLLLYLGSNPFIWRIFGSSLKMLEYCFFLTQQKNILRDSRTLGVREPVSSNNFPRKPE